MSRKSQIAIFPKIVLLVAAFLCLVDLFLPWSEGFGDGLTLAGSLPYSMSYFVILAATGAVVLLFNGIGIISKGKGINLAANIISLILGLVLALTMIFSVVADTSYDLVEYREFGYWLALVLSIITFIFSIISMVANKRKD